MDSLLHLILVYRYWILFPLACIEGPIIAFVIGTLVALHYFNIFAAYLLLVLGDIVPDTAYYFLGRYSSRGMFVTKALKTIGVSKEQFGVIEKLWRVHTGKTMFFSKLAYGLSTPFLISAGFIKLDFKKFLMYALPVTFGQYAVLIFLGYYFGASYYEKINMSFEGVGLLIAAAIIVAVLYALLSRFMRRKLLQAEKEAEK